MASIYKGLLPLIGGGAISLAMTSEDAEAAKIPNFNNLLRDAYYAGQNWNMRIGNLEPNLWEQVQKVSPSHAKNNVVTSPHAVESRRGKDGWSPERTIDAMGEVLDDNKYGVVVKNWQKPTGKGNQADYGILMPFDIDPSFTPFFTDKNGNIVFKTTFPPHQGNLKVAGFGVEGGNHPLISRDHSELQKSWPGTQPQPISVVTPNNPAVGNTIADLTGLGKKIVPATAATTAVLWPKQAADGKLIWRADTPEAAPQEQGLERPAWDPIDAVTAPVGMTTMAGKAIATAADPLIAYGTDKALGALLGMFQRRRSTGGGGGA